MAKRYRFRFKGLDVYQAAVAHFSWTVQVVARMPRGPFVVVNQAVGSSLSILGNIGEANGREKMPGEIEQHYRYAQGSTFESASYLDALSALQVIDDDEYNDQEELLARIASMITRLMQSQRRHRPPRRAQRSGRARGPQGSRGSAAVGPPPGTPGKTANPGAPTNLEKRGPQARASKTEGRRPDGSNVEHRS